MLIRQISYTRYYLRFRQVQKLADKMLALLAIMVSRGAEILLSTKETKSLLYSQTTLCPGKRVDEQVMNLMRETLGDKLTMIQRGDELAFQDLFANACPKFVSPMPMSYDDVPNPEMVSDMRVYCRSRGKHHSKPSYL